MEIWKFYVSWTNMFKLGIIICLVVISRSFHNPYVSFAIPVYFGVNVLARVSKNISLLEIFSLGPAVGFSTLILLIYLGSITGIGVSNSVAIYTLLAVLSTFLVPPRKVQLPKKELVMLGIPLTIIFLVHFVAYTYPTDNVDNFFHAIKIKHTIMEDSVFPNTVPFQTIKGYPWGYHATVSYLVIITGSGIPTTMRDFRVLGWVLLVLGVYIFSVEWFGKRIAHFALLAMLTTNICYYYLIVYIEPNFFGFYFFLIMLTLLKKYLSHNNPIPNPMIVLIGASTLLIHPYAFENYVLLGAIYLILLKLKKNNPKISYQDIAMFVVMPLVLFMIMDPYVILQRLGGNIVNNSVDHDTFKFLKFTIEWSLFRNMNYAGTLMILSALIIGILRKNMEILALFIYWGTIIIFAILRISFKLSYLIIFKFAAVERMYLWLVPVIPIIIGIGMEAIKETMGKNRFTLILYTLVLVAFFIIPSQGIARDLLSAEANFYVTPNNIEDFAWVSAHVPSAIILNSCYSDSVPWLPFFVKGEYTVMFNHYRHSCIYDGATLNQTIEYLLTTNSTLPKTIAFIDTNAPNLNPLPFLSRYTLLRINGNDWIFNMSSNNISKNNGKALDALRLCDSTLPGNTFRYGKYYIWGFTKKYFYVTYFALDGKYFAWIMGNAGTIAFNPCKEYNKVTLSMFANRPMEVNITINNKLLRRNYRLRGGFNRITLNETIFPNQINTITISKTRGVLLIREIKLGERE